MSNTSPLTRTQTKGVSKFVSKTSQQNSPQFINSLGIKHPRSTEKLKATCTSPVQTAVGLLILLCFFPWEPFFTLCMETYHLDAKLTQTKSAVGLVLTNKSSMSILRMQSLPNISFTLLIISGWSFFLNMSMRETSVTYPEYILL